MVIYSYHKNAKDIIIKKIIRILITASILCLMMPITAFADSFAGGVLTIDGFIMSSNLSSRVSAAGGSQAGITELHVTATGLFDISDLTYINGCTNMTILNVDTSITSSSPDNFLDSHTAIQQVTFPAVNFTGSSFASTPNLTTVTLPNALTFTGDAFGNCLSLFSVNLPSVTSFGDICFANCTNLTSIDLPSATSFSDNAFYNCTSLSSVSLPSAPSFGDTAFVHCTSLISIDLPSVTSFGSEAFINCTNLSSISLPSVTSFGDGTFSNCTSLSTITLPSVTSFGSDTFDGCTSPMALNLGSSIPTVTSFAASIPVASSTLTVPTNAALATYDADTADGTAGDGLWYGFVLQVAPVTTPTTPTVVTNPQTGEPNFFQTITTFFTTLFEK